MKKLNIYTFSIFVLILSSLSTIILCIEESPIILMPFKGKSLQREEDPDADDYSTHWSTDEYGNPIPPEMETYNATRFLNYWFYNGMYSVVNVGSDTIQAYINMKHSKLSIEKCDVDRIYSKALLNNKYFYKPFESSTYSEKDNKIGNDIFSFYGDMRYRTYKTIGEEKGKGLDFYFTAENDDTALCGNLGFNMNVNSDKTNLIYQLKNRKYIKEYIWTLKYQTEEDGIIVVGTEPHFYDDYYMSQYVTIKAIQNQSPETAWSFKMDEVSTYDENKNKVVFSQNKVDFLVDRGLIIGTDEYKKKIDELFFDDLIDTKKVCKREVSVFSEAGKNEKDEYYVYYCDRNDFMGNKYSSNTKYYGKFPNLDFYIKEHNYTFILSKEHLFYAMGKIAFFLVVFKKSDTENKIWKFGEPFFSHYQLTFNQDKKTVGFYDYRLEKIKNEDYIKIIEQKKQENNQKNENIYKILKIILIVVGFIAFVALAYFLGKKLNESRKKRANELSDDDFDYSINKKGDDDAINDS